MVRALERGLTLNDFKDLTLGMIISYISTYNDERNENDEKVIDASQNDFNAF